MQEYFYIFKTSSQIQGGNGFSANYNIRSI